MRWPWRKLRTSGHRLESSITSPDADADSTLLLLQSSLSLSLSIQISRRRMCLIFQENAEQATFSDADSAKARMRELRGGEERGEIR